MFHVEHSAARSVAPPRSVFHVEHPAAHAAGPPRRLLERVARARNHKTHREEQRSDSGTRRLPPEHARDAKSFARLASVPGRRRAPGRSRLPGAPAAGSRVRAYGRPDRVGGVLTPRRSRPQRPAHAGLLGARRSTRGRRAESSARAELARACRPPSGAARLRRSTAVHVGETLPADGRPPRGATRCVPSPSPLGPARVLRGPARCGRGLAGALPETGASARRRD